MFILDNYLSKFIYLRTSYGSLLVVAGQYIEAWLTATYLLHLESPLHTSISSYNSMFTIIEKYPEATPDLKYLSWSEAMYNFKPSYSKNFLLEPIGELKFIIKARIYGVFTRRWVFKGREYLCLGSKVYLSDYKLVGTLVYIGTRSLFILQRKNLNHPLKSGLMLYIKKQV